MAIQIWLDKVKPAPEGFRGFTNVEAATAFLNALGRHPSRPRAHRIDVSAEYVTPLVTTAPAFPRILRVHGTLTPTEDATLRAQLPEDCWLAAA